ncbi:hypothetical protein LSH36_116g00025 [Paralvinella palmiformis]|uniref:Uncharacterized protein n=1 Tax=Paralvinella palmiformis TaxID=53620 RepID=A0AAD9JYL1_9ANNE|nr:hypothetical protein LSH36_116g00025 [Paralvinella palmiformis]
MKLTSSVLFLAKKNMLSTKTRHKDNLDEEALRTLQERIHLHQRLYAVAKIRFYKMFDAVRKLKALS